jgi:peptidoglycan/xylan/chitin deacetylase (PgdA/CDA1 family)
MVKYVSDLSTEALAAVLLILLALATGLLLGISALFQWEAEATPATPAIHLAFVTPTPLPPQPAPAVVVPVDPTLQPSPTPVPYFAGGNEMGQVMILEYHAIGYPEIRYRRSPDNLRADLAQLHAQGYYPVNFIDLLNGLPDVPPGKKPVVLTFDDSNISQFKVLEDGSIDPDSAVGILLAFHQQHPEDWPLKATFFVLGNPYSDYETTFGQPDLAEAKLQFLVDSGMEVASHTVTHADLSVSTAEELQWELATSKRVLEDLIPGYTVQTMAVPFGAFPHSVDFLASGQWGELEYSYAGNAHAWGGPTDSPHSPAFKTYRVPRLEVTGQEIDYWLSYFAQYPEAYYVSDGDPGRLTVAPQEAAFADE